ncbi:hypothetical protein HPB49_006703 [Dermacentor silvarum]|uniref:Uncharacterized protein n=1 Tax=Dermacentor silvarum TaxID=543639 RepID=A0ACB8CVN6_DERSI|nr:hypothetical protein HPB49_006703 [Dermacentor silvarum]
MTLDGERHDVTAYVAAEAQHARCVVHGLPKDIPDDQLLPIISIEDRHILAARRLGQSETILLTVKGATVPKEVKMGLWLTKTQPFRPRAVQCTICFTIGHRADVCPTAHEFTRCETCGQQFPPAQRPDQTAHECEVRCFNCEGPHGARDPRCPKKQQADKLTRLAAERRRLNATSKDSGQPQNGQTSQSIATNPPKKTTKTTPRYHSTTALKLYEIRHRTQNRSPDPDLAVCQATQRKDRRHPRHHPSRKPQVLCGPCSPRSRPRIPKKPRRSNPGTPPQKRAVKVLLNNKVAEWMLRNLYGISVLASLTKWSLKLGGHPIKPNVNDVFFAYLSAVGIDDARASLSSGHCRSLHISLRVIEAERYC